MNNKKVAKQGVPYLILIIMMLGILLTFNLGNRETHEISYNELISELAEDNVKSITISERTSAGVYYITGQLDDYNKNETFKTNVPLSDSVMDRILNYADKNEFKVETDTNPENNTLLVILVSGKLCFNDEVK